MMNTIKMLTGNTPKDTKGKDRRMTAICSLYFFHFLY